MNLRNILFGVPLIFSVACGTERANDDVLATANTELACQSSGRATIVSRNRDNSQQQVDISTRYTDEDGDGLVDYYIIGPAGILVADSSDSSLDYGERQLVNQGRYIDRKSEEGKSIQLIFNEGKSVCDNSVARGN